MSEKRKTKRINKKIKSEVHSSEGMTFSPSENFSKGGIFISTPEPVAVGTEITLSLYIPDMDDAVDIKGVVKWIREEEKGKNSGMGIEFVNSSDKELEIVKKIVDN